MHFITYTAIALAAVATVITTAVLASNRQTGTAKPLSTVHRIVEHAETAKDPLLATVRHIVERAETTKDPLPTSATPGFKCFDNVSGNILVCYFVTKPTLNQAKAILAEFKSMNAAPRFSTYREDNGRMHEFRGGEWYVTNAGSSHFPDVYLGCEPRTHAHYHIVRFEFVSRPTSTARPSLLTTDRRIVEHVETAMDPLLATVRRIVEHVETALDPLPASDTPGFTCHDNADHYILSCDFAVKPTFDQAKAIVAECESMNAASGWSYYREDNDAIRLFDGEKWDEMGPSSSLFLDVFLQCEPRTSAYYHKVGFTFGNKK